MFFPQQQSEPVQIIPAEPSKELRFRRNLTKVCDFLAWLGVGALATTMVQIYPTYWGLYVLGSGVGTVALILFPNEDRFQFYRVLSLVGGLILPWWGLVYLIKPIHIAGAIGLLLAIVFVIGAIGGGQ